MSYEPEVPAVEVSALEILLNTTEETMTMSKATLRREAVGSLGASI